MIFSTIIISNSNSFAQIVVNKGYIDLSDYNFNDNKIIELNGDWEFYYNQTLSNNDIITNSIEPLYFPVPSLWNNKTIDKIKLSNKSNATYRLKIKASPQTKYLSVRTMRIFSAYKLFVNDSLIIKVGEIEQKTQKEIAGLKTVTATFIVPDTVFYLTIQMSSYSHRKAGIQSVIEIGLPKYIFKKSRIAKSIEIFILGVMIIMAFYHIGLFVLWKKNTSALYFGFLLISVSLHLTTNEEVLMSYFIDIFPTEFLYKIDFMTNNLTGIFIILFFYSINPKYYNKIVIYTQIAILSLIVLVIIFSKTEFYSHTLIVFEIVVVIFIPYILFNLIRAVVKNRKNSIQELTGTIILFGSALNDILYENSIIDTGYITWLGLTLFIVIQSNTVARRYTNLFNHTDELNSITSELDYIKNKILNEKGSSIDKTLEIIATKSNVTRSLLFITKNGDLDVKAYYSKYIHTERDSYPANLIELSLKEKQIIKIENAYTENKFFDSNYLNNFKVKSAFCMPLISDNDVKGIIYFENEMQTEIFSDRTEQIISLLSNQIMNIIDNYDKFNELDNLNLKLEETIEERTIEVMQQREELKTQKDEIERQNEYLNSIYDEISLQNKGINDSINYAKRMQIALLPNKNTLTSAFPNNFILFKPKDILSGDFYWIHEAIKQDLKVFAVADCTGHGVPGALMSIIGNNLLFNQVTGNKILEPATILDNVQTEISHKLKQNIMSESKDGMDLAIIAYDKENSLIKFSGARNPLIMIRDNELTEFKGDRMSIGGAEHARIGKESRFTNQDINTKEGDVFYMFSDGYADQIGGKRNRKFMKKKFYELLLSIHEKPMLEQQETLLETIKLWKADNIQVDDMLVAGLRI